MQYHNGPLVLGFVS